MFAYVTVLCCVICFRTITIVWATTKVDPLNGWPWKRCKRKNIQRPAIVGVSAFFCGNWPLWQWCRSKKWIRLSWLPTLATDIAWDNRSTVQMNCNKRWFYFVYSYILIFIFLLVTPSCLVAGWPIISNDHRFRSSLLIYMIFTMIWENIFKLRPRKNANIGTYIYVHQI